MFQLTQITVPGVLNAAETPPEGSFDCLYLLTPRRVDFDLPAA